MLQLKNFIVFLAITTFSIQAISIKINNTRFDLTAVLLLIALVIFLPIFKFKKNEILIYFLFVLSQIIIISFNFDSIYIYRYFSAFIWLSLCFFLITGSLTFEISERTIFRIVMISILMQSLMIIVQYHFFGYIRPKGLFSEPSSAGLAIFSAIYALYATNLIKKNNSFLIYIIFLIYIGSLTRSIYIITHIVLFLILIILIKSVIKYFKLKQILILIIIFLYLLNIILNNQNILDRIIFEELNLSQMIWLRGLEQTYASIKQSFIFGYGFGATGTFEFSSKYNEKLLLMKMYELNLFDSYSLLFRLVIEIGILNTFFFLYFFYKKIKYNFNKNYYEDRTSYYYFNRIFCFFIILGCLLKEPLYPNSLLLVSLLVFFKK